jgi:hypothetical protein
VSVRLAPAAIAFVASATLVAAAWRREPPPLPVDRSSDAVAYRQACSRCHPPFDPQTHLRSEWRAVVTSMHQRMADREVRIPPDQLEAAIRWLEQNGR